MKKSKIVIANYSISLFYISLYISLLLSVIICGITKIGHILGLYDYEAAKNTFIFLIVLLSLLIIFSSLQFFSALFANETTFSSSKPQFIFLSIVSLNIALLIINIIYASTSSDSSEESVFKIWKSNFKQILGLRKWNNIDYALISIFCAVCIVLGFIENYLPHLPYGGGFGLKYIPLIVLAFVHSFLASWVSGAVAALIGLLYIPANNIVSPWSYLLDYFLPLTSPALVAFFKFKVTNDKSLTTYLNYIIISFLTVTIIFIWQVLAGVIVWNTVFPDQIWTGYNGWTYSLIYNFIHNYLFTLPFIILVTPVLLRTLTPIYDKYTF